MDTINSYKDNPYIQGTTTTSYGQSYKRDEGVNLQLTNFYLNRGGTR
jgi:hypothetical protein